MVDAVENDTFEIGLGQITEKMFQVSEIEYHLNILLWVLREWFYRFIIFSF